MPCRPAVAVICLTAALASPARGQVPPPAAEDPALQRLVEEALERNPELIAAGHSVSAARERPAQAGSRTGPMLGLLYTNDGWSPSLGTEEMTTLAFMASQDLPYPGKRRLRREVAEADAGLARWEVERVRLNLVSAVKRAYYGLVLARALAALAGEQRDLWRQVEETARVRYASAVGPQQELLRAQVEGTRLQALHAQHHAEARARLAELNRLLGRAVAIEVDTPATLGMAPSAGSLEEWLARSESISPELRAATDTLARDELAITLAQSASRPDFVVQAGYMSRGGLPPMWQAGVSVELPSRSAAKAAVAEASAKRAASEARLQDIRLRLRAAVDQRIAFLLAAEAIEEAYRAGVLPQGQTAVESAVARYGAGQGAQPAVLEALIALLEDRTDYLRLVRSHAAERARLDEASLEAPAMDSLLAHGRTGGMGTGAGAMAPPGPMPPRSGSSSTPEMR